MSQAISLCPILAHLFDFERCDLAYYKKIFTSFQEWSEFESFRESLKSICEENIETVCKSSVAYALYYDENNLEMLSSVLIETINLTFTACRNNFQSDSNLFKIQLAAYLMLALSIIAKRLDVKPLYYSMLPEILDIVKFSYYCPHSLSLLHLYVTSFNDYNCKSLLFDLLNVMMSNFSNEYRIVRLLTISIFKTIEGRLFTADESSNLKSLIIQNMYLIESVETSFEEFRERSLLLQKIPYSSLPNDIEYSRLLYASLVRFIACHYSINLNLYWNQTDDLLKSILRTSPQDFQAIWWNLFKQGFDNLISSIKNEGNCSKYRNYMVSAFDLVIKTSAIEKQMNGDRVNFSVLVLKFSSTLNSLISSKALEIYKCFIELYNLSPFGLHLRVSTLDDFFENSKSEDYANKKLYVSLIKIFLSFFSLLKNLSGQQFSNELLSIVTPLISNISIDIQRAAITCFSAFRTTGIPKKLRDELLGTLDQGALPSKDALKGLLSPPTSNDPPVDSCESTLQGSNMAYNLVIRILFGIGLRSKSLKQVSNSLLFIFNNLDTDASNFDWFITFLLDMFPKDFSQPLRFITFKNQKLFLTIIDQALKSLLKNLLPYLESIIHACLYTGLLCNTIYDNLPKSDILVLLKDTRKDLNKLVAKLLRQNINVRKFHGTFLSAIIRPLASQKDILSIGESYIDLLTAMPFNDSCWSLLYEDLSPLLDHDTSLLSLLVVSIKNVKPTKFTQILSGISMFFKRFTESKSSCPDKGPQFYSQYIIPVIEYLKIYLKEEANIKTEISNSIAIVFDSFIDFIFEFQITVQINDLYEIILKIPMFSNKYHKPDYSYFVITLSKLLRTSQTINDENFLLLIDWIYKIEDFQLRTTMFQALLDSTIISSCIYEIITDLTSWQHLGDKDGPDIERKSLAFQSLTLEKMEVLFDSQILVYLLFKASLFGFSSSISDLSISLSFFSFLPDFLRHFQKTVNNHIHSRIMNLLLKTIKGCLNHYDESHFNAGVSVLRIVIKEKVYSPLVCLFDLCNSDDSLDFFHNIIHLQISQKQKALSQIKIVINEEKLTVKILKDYILSILMFFLRGPTSMITKYHNLRLLAIEIVGSISKFYSWGSYVKLVKRFLPERVEVDEESLKVQKLNIKLLGSILDNFNFTVKHEGDETSISTGVYITQEDVKGLFQQLITKFQTRSVCDFNREFIPAYSAINESVAKAPLALVLVRILKNLDNSFSEPHRSTIILQLCGMISSQHYDLRITGRKILASVATILGPGYINLILQHLSSTLTKGFQKHVLVYTIHHILEKLEFDYSKDINESLSLLLTACLSDQFGIINEERQVKAISVKIKETQKSKGLAIFRIIGANIFETNINSFIENFNSILLEASAFEILSKLKRCIDMFLEGILQNKHLSQNSLLIFSHVCIRDFSPNLQKTTEDNTSPPVVDSRIIPPDPRRTTTKKNSDFHYRDILVSFGLKLLYSLLCSKNIDNKEQVPDSMIQPSIPFILKFIEANFSEAAICSVLCLKALARKNYPAILNSIDGIYHVSYNYVKFLINSTFSDSVLTSGVKLLSVILKRLDKPITNDMALTLLLFCEENIAISSKQIISFSLLKVLLNKKLRIPELKTIMNTIKVHSITSPSQDTRQYSSRLVVLFLKKYKCYLSEYIDFYISNFTYEDATGRISSLEVVLKIFSHVNFKKWSNKSSAIYINLIQLIANDDNGDVRKAGFTALSSLISIIPTPARSKYFKLVQNWFTSLNLNLVEVGCLILNCFVQIEKSEILTRLPSIINPIICCLEAILKKVGYKAISDTTDPTPHDGEFDLAVFQILNSFHNIIVTTEIFSTSKQRELPSSFIEWSFRLMDFPHFWVRVACAKIFLAYFKVHDAKTISKNFSNPSKLKLLKTTQFYFFPKDINELSQILQFFIDLSIFVKTSQENNDIGFKGLIYITEIVINITDTIKDFEINIATIFHNLFKLSNKENQLKKYHIKARQNLLKWIATILAVCATRFDSQKSNIFNEELLKEMFYFVNREMTTHRDDNPLHDTATEVFGILKKSIDKKVFLKIFSDNTLSIKNTKRVSKSKNSIQKAKNFKSFYKKKVINN